MPDLARRLRVSVAELEEIAAAKSNYRLFVLNGRSIEEPKRRLQRIHARVHRLLSRVSTPEYLHSAVKGRSYITNALSHEGGPLLKIDVHRFYQSVPRRVIFEFFFHQMRCAADVAAFLSSLLTFDRHLATGSSASPILSYYAFQEMFDEIHQLAHRSGCTMTCYVDDIAISGSAACRKMLHDVRRIISRHGLHGHKAKFFEEGRPRVVTGVALTRSGPRVPNRRLLRIHQGFAVLRACSTDEERLNQMNRLLSRMYEAAQIDPNWRLRALSLQADKRELMRRRQQHLSR